MEKIFLTFCNKRYVFSAGAPTCGTEELPAVSFDPCRPNIRLSEIRRIFLAKVAAANFTNWESIDEWNARVNKTSTHVDAIREIIVTGDKPLPISTKKDLSFQRRKTVRKDHVVNAIIDDVTDANHELIRYIGNGKWYKLWYETTGGKLAGGNGGIVAYVSADMLLQRGAGEIMVYVISAAWDTLETEEMCESPVFDTDAVFLMNDNGLILYNDDGTPLQSDHF